MKKIFTLLFAVGLFAAAQAQPGNRDNRQNEQRNNQRNDQRDDADDDRYDNGKNVVMNHNRYDNDDRYRNDDYYGNDDRYGNSRFSNERKMKMQVARINQEFDYKIQQARNNYFMSRWEKQRLIHSLEDQRQQDIRMVYAKFKYKNKHNDRDDHNRCHN